MNTHKSLLYSIGAISIIALGILFIRSSKQIDQPVSQTVDTSSTTSVSAPVETVTPSTPRITPPTTPPPAAPGSYTLADVALHNNQSNCWTAINGNVYNVTSWIGEHPGGSRAILSLCGIDGSAAFNDEHGGQKRPTSELASFKIGALKK